jgi:hypothetical protein
MLAWGRNFGEVVANLAVVDFEGYINVCSFNAQKGLMGVESYEFLEHFSSGWDNAAGQCCLQALRNLRLHTHLRGYP